MASSFSVESDTPMCHTPPLIQLRDAEVRRNGKTILSVDSFSLDNGRSVALLGPNGSGKSTFVKLITREIVPLYRDRPPVLFQGTDRIVLSDVHRQLGVVSSSMQDQMTVHLPAVEVVEGGLFGTLGLPTHIHPTDKTRAMALDALERLHIAELADRDILSLSTGQARRVLIARALIHNPHTLIFDEPCTGLDPQGMHHVRASMSELAASGKGVVLVTHYLEDIVPEIDTIALIKDGRLEDCGPKERLLTSERISKLFDTPCIVTKTIMSQKPTDCFPQPDESSITAVADESVQGCITTKKLDFGSAMVHGFSPETSHPVSSEAEQGTQKPVRMVFSLTSIY